MKQVNVGAQRRIVCNPNNPANTTLPTMPLLIVLPDGTIGEATTIRGAAAIIMGNEYLDAEDGVVEWHMRVEKARKEAMKALQYDINAVVYDSRKGIIKNNYAAASGDYDYAHDENEPVEMPVKIMIDNDRLFILSLMKLGAIKALEREDSYILRPHPEWSVLSQNNSSSQCCENCLNGIPEDGSIICPVYNQIKQKTEGTICGSYSISVEQSKPDYTGGKYIDIGQEYDVEELIHTFISILEK